MMLTSLFVCAFLMMGSTNSAELTGSEVISAVTADQWEKASANKIVVTINENPYGFKPKDLSLVAGTAYILRIENNATNTGKHYYSSPDLFASSAMRKIQTHMAEMKADFLGDVELLAPTVEDDETTPTATWAEWYFVPMKSGSYEVVCTIGDHALLGMNGTITVTDDNGITNMLITDWASDYTVDTKDVPDPRRSGDDPVWNSVETVEVEILSPFTLDTDNMADYGFNPSNVELVADQGYVLKILQVGDGTNDKHYYTAPEFFKTVVTRKLQDASAEVKLPYINAVELTDTVELAGQETFLDVYIVPTVPGVYNVTCTISGHAQAGMDGTITVRAAKTADQDYEEEPEISTEGDTSNTTTGKMFPGLLTVLIIPSLLALYVVVT